LRIDLPCLFFPLPDKFVLVILLCTYYLSGSILEQWRDVVGYEGFYQVSDLGRVRSLVRLLPEAHARGVRKEKQVLRFGSNKQGRLQVTLCMEGVTRRFQVHTLVLLAFVGPRPDGMECLHDDNDYTNNRPSNLRWGTHLENMRDKARHGTQQRGEQCSKAKLTEADVVAIRSDKRPSRAVAASYGVSQVCVIFIRKRKTWKHVA
jgi:hypothetical protein